MAITYKGGRYLFFQNFADRTASKAFKHSRKTWNFQLNDREIREM